MNTFKAKATVFLDIINLGGGNNSLSLDVDGKLGVTLISNTSNKTVNIPSTKIEISCLRYQTLKNKKCIKIKFVNMDTVTSKCLHEQLNTNTLQLQISGDNYHSFNVIKARTRNMYSTKVEASDDDGETSLNA